MSEALLFAEHGKNMLCTKVVLNVRNNFCTQHVHSMAIANLNKSEELVTNTTAASKPERGISIDADNGPVR